MRLLFSSLIILLFTLSIQAQDTQYEIIARLGDGRLGNAVFSPDSTQLAVATSMGIDLYELSDDSINSVDSPSLQNMPARFVAYTSSGESLIYVEPVRFIFNEGVYSTKLVTDFRIWQVDLNSSQSPMLITEISLDNIARRIAYLPESNQIIFASSFQNDESNFTLIDIDSGAIHPTTWGDFVSPKSWWQDLENGYTLISPDGRWEWQYHHTYDEEIASDSIWYDIIRSADDVTVASSYDEIESISLDPDKFYWTEDNQIVIVEDARCGTGYQWDWQDGILSSLSGYGGCGDDRSCTHSIGLYCLAFGSYDPETRQVNPNDITIVYDDWSYLEPTPNIEDPDFQYVAEGHTDSVIFLNTPSSNTIMSGSLDNTAILWDVSLSDDDFSMTIGHIFEHPNAVTYVGYNQKNTDELMTASGGNIYFWDIASGELLNTLAGHHEPILRLSWSRDKKYFASASSDGIVLVWGARA